MSRLPSVPEAFHRPFLFKNVSGETIPPFAAMQLVGDPEKWDMTIIDDPNTGEWEKSAHKMVGAQAFFDNEILLFCDKPGIVSELLQDASLIAFNGASPVDKDQKGRCTWGQYPVRAKTSTIVASGLYTNLAVARNTWELSHINSSRGSFRGVLSLEGKEKEAKDRVSFVNVGGLPPTRNPLFVKGVWSTGENPLDQIKFEVTTVGDDAELAYDLRDGGLGLAAPGVYQFNIDGIVSTNNLPSTEIDTVPYRIAFEKETDSYGEGFSQIWIPALEGEPEYAKSTLERYGPVENYQYRQHYFRMNEIIGVKKSVYRPALRQTASPFIKASGQFSVTYNYQLYDATNYFGWGNYGYNDGFWWGTGYAYAYLNGGSPYFYYRRYPN